MNIRKLTTSEVTFTIGLEPEDTPFEGNAMVSGDDDADREHETWIRARLERDQQEAWCYVKVSAEWQGIKAHVGLGGCSFDFGDHPSGDRVARGLERFAREEGLKDEALEALNAEVQRQADKARELLAKVTIDAG